MDEVAAKPVVFAYQDYRLYLRDFRDYQVAHQPGFSVRNFSRRAEIKAPTYLNLVIEGRRNLKSDTVNKFLRALQMSGREARYFETLVLFNQARNEKDRDLYLQRLVALRPQTKLTRLQKDQYAFYKFKYFLTIHQMAYLKDFRADPEWIAERVEPPLKPSVVAFALEALQRLKLLVHRDGKLQPAEVSFSTPAEVSSIEIKQYHRNMVSDAKEALFEFDKEVRDFSSLTSPVPLSALPEFKKRIQDFREEINDWLNRRESEAEEVFQLNIQLFPLTRISDPLRRKKAGKSG